MPVTENDLETLEGWLDGELTDEQLESLRRRISAEPELAQAMDRLRADRQIRSQFFQALEPGAAEVDALVSAVRSSVRKEDVWSSRFRSLRAVSGIAASIVLVFMVGWVSRSRLQIGNQVSRDTQKIVVPERTTPATFFPIDSNSGTGQLEFSPAGFKLTDPRVPNPQPGGYKVQIVDSSGKVISQRPMGQFDAVLIMSEPGKFQLQPQPRSSDAVNVDHQQR